MINAVRIQHRRRTFAEIVAGNWRRHWKCRPDSPLADSSAAGSTAPWPARPQTLPAAADCCSPQTNWTGRQGRSCRRVADKPSAILRPSFFKWKKLINFAKMSFRRRLYTLQGLMAFWVEAHMKLWCNLKYLPRWVVWREVWQSGFLTTVTGILFNGPDWVPKS